MVPENCFIAFCVILLMERQTDKQHQNIVSLAEVMITKKIHYQSNLTKKTKNTIKARKLANVLTNCTNKTIKLCPKLEVAQLWQRDHASLIDDFKGHPSPPLDNIRVMVIVWR